MVRPSRPRCVWSCSEVSSHFAFNGMHAYHVDDGKPHLLTSPLDSSGKCPSSHEVWECLLMEKYSYLDMLSNVMPLHPRQSGIQRCLSSIFVDPWSAKTRSPNSSARDPLTRDLSSLDFVELQNRMSSPHAARNHKSFQECPSKLSSFLTAR